MKTLEELKARFRRIDAAAYPEVAGLGWEAVYSGKMGPGGLYLAARLARELELRAGQVVLDLGCGNGATAVFLAQRYGVTVVALDWWIPAGVIAERARAGNVRDRVVPLHLDVTGVLPFGEGYFDAMLCMDAVHYFGDGAGFWGHLLVHLKRGGLLGVGSPCFDREFTAAQVAARPVAYDEGPTLWSKEFSRYHSPGWWGQLVGETAGVQVRKSEELAEGVVLWEDDTLFNVSHGQSEEAALRDARQIVFGREHPGWPSLTHFVMVAERM